MKFYEYNQNNSGGSFNFDKKAGIGYKVFIEAETAKKANSKAEDIGLYFNGCETDMDCPCCGDRWYSADESDGTEQPTFYGVIHDPNGEEKINWDGVSYIHYADGKIETFKVKKDND